MISTSYAFDQPLLDTLLADACDEELDALDFGVIAFDAKGTVRRYNRFESEAAGLSSDRVVGHHLFQVVAPCMNNFLVAMRFEEAAEAMAPLDVTLDYVLTLRMRPVKVKLRLLAAADASALRFVLVQRKL